MRGVLDLMVGRSGKVGVVEGTNVAEGVLMRRLKSSIQDGPSAGTQDIRGRVTVGILEPYDVFAIQDLVYSVVV